MPAITKRLPTRPPELYLTGGRVFLANRIYGMTGGQYSPLTAPGMLATTAPYTNIDQGFDIVEMAKAARVTFVARTTTFHVQQMAEIIRVAVVHEGFSSVPIDFYRSVAPIHPVHPSVFHLPPGQLLFNPHPNPGLTDQHKKHRQG